MSPKSTQNYNHFPQGATRSIDLRWGRQPIVFLQPDDNEMSEDSLSSLLWDGDRIVGGEPRWFAESVQSRRIERSAEGTGTCLIAYNKSGAIIVRAGECISLHEGEFKIPTLSSLLSDLGKAAKKSETRHFASHRLPSFAPRSALL